jgi:RNA polymerase sigma-70 factor (ECF subfamily)
MKHYQGLKLRAIGEVLGTTEETVKNSLFRATRKLRSQLGGLR